MNACGRILVVLSMGLLVAVGACSKKSEGGGGGGGAAPANEDKTFTPDQAEKILAKADELIDEELGKKGINGSLTPEEGMRYSQLQTQAVEAGGVAGVTAFDWVSFLMKDENDKLQMRWLSVVGGQPDPH